MTAGYNQVSRIWRTANPLDDSIGGAVPSGTVLYDFVEMRIEPIEPTIALLEQGLETQHLFRSVFSAKANGIRENDIVDVYLPQDSWYYGYRFRLISIQHPSLKPSDLRSNIVVIMRRMDIAHAKSQS